MTLRRDFLAFAAGAVAAKTVLPTAARAEARHGGARFHPDAELMRLGRLFDRANTQEQAAWVQAEAVPAVSDDDPDYVRADTLAAETSKIVELIQTLAASTLDGVLVKVRAIMWCRINEDLTPEELSGNDAPTTDMRLLSQVVMDLSAMGKA